MIKDPKPDGSIKWSDIEACLDSLQSVEGGFSGVKKGLLTLTDNSQVFIKLAIDEYTNKWTRKEVAMYRFLNAHGYPHIPKLLAANDDDTGFVLEALTSKDGWDWGEHWTDDRLDATFSAIDDLANIKISTQERQILQTKTLSEEDNGWIKLLHSEDMLKTLNQKLTKVGKPGLANSLNINAMVRTSSQFTFKNDTLVHNDIRADNCAWNPDLGKVRLIDWNWAQIGDTRIDNAGLLVNVQKAGFNVMHESQKLDKGALQWMAGFWLAAAATPISSNGPSKLRDYQLESGVTALELARKL